MSTERAVRILWPGRLTLALWLGWALVLVLVGASGVIGMPGVSAALVGGGLLVLARAPFTGVFRRGESLVERGWWPTRSFPDRDIDDVALAPYAGAFNYGRPSRFGATLVLVRDTGVLDPLNVANDTQRRSEARRAVLVRALGRD
ncbi:hypothetical protein [Cellulomonas sp. PhB150]|uniref:hypothetical protein n=1 Tax=Cellulomonas sp. PhB150 TaxID=2485188 RepID=UPI000F483CCB|nr:hypothetical protein [Cellulomonas sp. PhB150]ROS31607.1 hypothetical protein EDF34_1270 [Cellulomonas sp. PhB150]